MLSRITERGGVHFLKGEKQCMFVGLSGSSALKQVKSNSAFSYKEERMSRLCGRVEFLY